jgi:hypothetical protein
LTAGTAAAGTTITITASSGTVSAKTTVTVANVQQTISLTTSAPQIPSDGSKSATITALVRNAQNEAVPGVTVNFSPSSGVVSGSPSTTDANGQATATLGTGGDPTNRSITVTATAGSSTKQITVNVVGTTLSISGPSSLIQAAQGTYNLVLSDAGGNGIANTAITLASAKGNTLSAGSVTTNSSGQATFTLTAKVGGADTVSATALGLTSRQTVTVSTQNFAFTTPSNNAEVTIAHTQTLTVVWTSNGAAVVGQAVTFSATRGTLSATAATTDSSGSASVTISSTLAGPSVISASASGVSSEVTVNFIATNPAMITLQASPNTIATEASSTLTATVRDANNNLVAGQVIDFLITQDSTGGSLSVPSATTNLQGQASTVYTATSATSATNGVVFKATVQGSTVTPGTTSLTVAGETVFLSLGTGNTIVALNQTQYEQPWSVQAVDASGAGINGVSIIFSVTSLGYIKGAYSNTVTGATSWVLENSTYNAGTYTTDPYALVLTGIGFIGCRTEDLAGNGILEPGEDYNNNGKLDPGLVASTDVGSATTGPTTTSPTTPAGTATFNVIYPKDHAGWVAVKLTATATVTGSQSSTSTEFILVGLASDYDNLLVSPPGQYSPYGSATTCANPN